MQILTIETSSLGDRSYLVHDGTSAAVVDPQRDIDRIERLLDEHGLRLEAVFETHVHNDYVTGGLELSRRHDATYYLDGGGAVTFAHTPIGDGDEIPVGGIVIRAVHTPGHTPNHMSYVVNDGSADRAVFTGGSLLFGSVGRTDLISAEMTEELTRAQHRSARRLADELADEVEVRPTHGFGSFCSSGETSGEDRSTIGAERRDNQALTIADEDEFVRTLVAGLDAYPSYYAHMAAINRTGPADVDLSPVEPVDTTELLRRIHAGEWIVDLRNRTAFARDHVTGTINIEFADNSSTYLGWLIPWGTPVTLLADAKAEIDELQRQLVRIGIDRPAGQFAGGMDAVGDEADRDAYPVGDFAAMREAADERDDVVVLDTRRQLEWDESHIVGAVHVPLHDLEARMSEIPAGQVWVHCASGYRSSIAASLLARAGRDVVLVDDEFDTAAGKFFDLESSNA